MSSKEKLDALLEKNMIVSFNLKDIKHTSENKINEQLGVKELLKLINEFYILRIKEKTPALKIVELRKDKLTNTLKNKKKIADKSLDYIFYVFTFSLSLFIFTGLLLDSDILFYLNKIFSLLSFFLLSISIFLYLKYSNLLIKRAGEKLVEEGLDFNDIIRQITIETVSEIKDYYKSFSNNKYQENLISFLVEENYFLEINKKKSIFKNIKNQVVDDIIEEEENLLDSKKIKNIEKTLEGQFNFLLEKNYLSIEKNKDKNDTLN